METYKDLAILTDKVDLARLEDPNLRDIAFASETRNVLALSRGYLLVKKNFQLLPSLVCDLAFHHSQNYLREDGLYCIPIVDTSLSDTNPFYEEIIRKILAQSRERVISHDNSISTARSLVTIHEQNPKGRNLYLFEHDSENQRDLTYWPIDFGQDIFAKYRNEEAKRLLEEMTSQYRG